MNTTLDPLALAAQLLALPDELLAQGLADIDAAVDLAPVRLVLTYLADSGVTVDMTALPTERGLTSYALTCAAERWHLERDPNRLLTAIPHGAVLAATRLTGIPLVDLPDTVPEQVRTALLPAGHGSTHVAKSFPHPPRRAIGV